VYDVFGNHKTALKAGFGKYNSAYSTGFTNNFNPMTGFAQNVTWSFTDPKAAGSRCAPTTFAGVVAPNPGCYPTAGFAAPFLPKSACSGVSAANCGLGGTVSTVTNPRLLRLALLVPVLVCGPPPATPETGSAGISRCDRLSKCDSHSPF